MRLFVFKTPTSTKAVMALDCVALTADKATVPGHVKLINLRPGMVVRPANDEGKPDITIAHTIKSVGQGTKGSNSNILFTEASKSSGPSKKKEKEEDESK